MWVMPPTAGGGGSLGQEGPGLQGVDGEELGPGPGGTTPIPHPGFSGSLERTGVRPPPSSLRMKGGEGGVENPHHYGVFNLPIEPSPPPRTPGWWGGGVPSTVRSTPSGCPS